MPMADLPPSYYSPLTMECVSSAAAEFALPEILVVAVMATEGGRVGMRRPNTNGSFDHGPMQVNSIEARRFFPYGISEERLAWDGCTNARVGAWLIKRRILEVRGDFWRGVARYHSKTPSRGRVYLNRVVAKIHELQTYPDRAELYVMRSAAPTTRTLYGS